MRLTAHQQQVIKQAAQDAFGPDVRVDLFGSRVDDTRRGGDIPGWGRHAPADGASP
ncbi:hypothetical protein [Thiohalocapsa halophila]|uniref:hypothetical protein n=1 Tax=Thiohalocapsa halophila TaxID=69359 RepID=UPI003F6918BD